MSSSLPPDPKPDPGGPKAHPEDFIWNPISRLLVSWIYPLIVLSSKRTLLEDDVWQMPAEFALPRVTGILQTAFENEKTRCATAGVGKKKPQPTLGWAIWEGFKQDFLVAYVLQFLFMLAQLGQPYLIG
jgi:hypothetical protein